MEEFEHMIVEEFKEEDFYETIEAPKFVDLTSPDHHLPEGDDRYWFCSRVGCDQKHEEFMDSEAIYKRFVLRVMAARSPSVRLRKALYRKDFSVDPKCPDTVPAKPSRSRVSRLAMISSIPHKPNGCTMRPKEVSTNKALTERKKQTHKSPAGFRSVQDPRAASTTTRALENRVVVAKSLVFASPKKLVRLKTNIDDQLQAREDPASVKESGLHTSKQLHIEGKENALPLECDDKENVTNAKQSHDKENSSDRKVFGNKESCETTQKGMTIIADNCFNGKTVSANNTRVKYTKPKLTNPKPFRLRTDERSILKESNMEKKPQLVVANEEETTNILGFHGENLGPKHEPVRLEKNTNFRSKHIRELVRHDSSADLVNCKRVVASGTKKQVGSKRVVTMEETTSVMNGESKEAAIVNKSSVASVEKRPLTVPKGPNFHCINVPKSCCCTKRMAPHV
ncbi:Uncharacterized protein Rs2_38159 [Raphanus sativus]|uniref:Uncharacterized protein LOC130498987 n=1 Tax=Raphanus sativus TaxID=3726 RepID=A0A9W3CBJ0_RAPSA|nr:uncharacterized protein LOC130498987 [Raphanus sativus]KAJ4881104.1 Uncharacterized protein Rs2_38159 [Raphanus sativus]